MSYKIKIKNLEEVQEKINKIKELAKDIVDTPIKIDLEPENELEMLAQIAKEVKESQD